MKRISKAGLAGALGLLVLGLAPLRAAEYFVALNGDDAAPGTKAQPFATLEKARDAARAARSEEEVTIWLRGGVYRRTNEFLLAAMDSGKAGAPIIYAAWPQEEVVLSGAIELKREWFEPLVDPALLKRIISKEAREKVLVIDLRARGIANFGVLGWHGYGMGVVGRGKVDKPKPAFLCVSGKRLSRARWPNPDADLDSGEEGAHRPRRKGIVRPAAIIDKAKPKGSEGGQIIFEKREDLQPGTSGGVFAYAFDRPALWRDAEEIWIDGVLGWTWEWTYNRILSIDHEKKQMTMAYPEASGLENQNNDAHFFFDNLLEEIDEPGEYYFDFKRGLICLYPPAGFDEPGSRIELAVADFPLLKLEKVSHVRFRDLVLDMGRDMAFQCEGATHVTIERCEVRNFLDIGVQCADGKSLLVTDCHFHDMGAKIILLARNGDAQTLEPGNAGILHSYFHDWSWYEKAFSPAVQSWESVGTRIAHNLFERSSHIVIWPSGNDVLVEYNEFRDVVRDFVDMGTVGAGGGRNPLQRGLVVRRNYFHDIGTRMFGQQGIYPDQMSMGVTIEENFFARVGSEEHPNFPVNINCGAHIKTRHNVFVDCPQAIHFARMAGDVNYPDFRPRWEKAMPREVIAGLPHAARYPELLRFWDEERQFPDTCTFEQNLLANPDVLLIGNGAADDVGTLQIRDNYCTETDPGFVNMAAGNYTLKSDSEVFRKIPDFPHIPFGEIGLRRKVGPFARTVPREFTMPARDPNAIRSRAISRGKNAVASSVFKDPRQYGADKAVDGNEGTRWIAEGRAGWVEVDLGSPMTFSRALILTYTERVEAFELQVKEGDAWRTVHKGGKIGKRTEVKFAPVTAQKVRLMITEASGYPEIAEFQLLAE